MPWKMILVLSNGATAVLATAPAKAPEKSELITERVCFRPCTAMEESHLEPQTPNGVNPVKTVSLNKVVFEMLLIIKLEMASD